MARPIRVGNRIPKVLPTLGTRSFAKTDGTHPQAFYPLVGLLFVVLVSLALYIQYRFWMITFGLVVMILSVAFVWLELSVKYTGNMISINQWQLIPQNLVEALLKSQLWHSIRRLGSVARNKATVRLSKNTRKVPRIGRNSICQKSTTLYGRKARYCGSPNELKVAKNKDVRPVEAADKVTATQCGTIIEKRGNKGMLIPHNLSADTMAQYISQSFEPFSATNMTNASNRQSWIIPFELDKSVIDADAVRVGQIVEFSILKDSKLGNNTAIDVRPVRSAADVNEEILKTRKALLTCKQAREESFVRAMEGVKVISPRNEPVIHHLDLIEYAANLDQQGDLYTGRLAEKESLFAILRKKLFALNF